MLPNLAWAGGVNLPTIILTERLMLYSFVLIVGLEAWLIYKRLPDLSKKSAFFVSLKSNLITMLLVVPLVWGTWCTIWLNLPAIIQHYSEFSVFKNIIIPFSRNIIVGNIVTAPWTFDTQSLLLAEWIMAPVYFIASYYLEYWFSRKKLKDFDKTQVKKAFFYANLYSYLMIMSFETIYQFIIAPYKATNPYLF